MIDGILYDGVTGDRREVRAEPSGSKLQLTHSDGSQETIDADVKAIVEETLKLGGKLLLTADHGNCEFMINADGSPNTAHTTNIVHLIYVAADAAKYEVKDGILADVAPTLLEMLGLQKPKEMTGSSLLKKK